MNHEQLGLVVKAGPRKGEKIESRPGSVIKIGRICKANTFVIKEAAISSNHLLIKYDYGKWSIQDLDSSNGTFVNGVQIRPFHDFNLNDGDLIKIGEVTSIAVAISACDAVLPQLRRSTRRRAPLSKEKVEAVPSISRNRNGRACAKAAKQKLIQSEPNNSTKGTSVRRGRPRKAAVSSFNEEIAMDTQNVTEIETPGKRRSRRRKQTTEKIPEINDAPDLPLVDESKEASGEEMGSASASEMKDSIESVIDLKKMTVGEWLDYLKVEIEKEIHEETEKIIESMKLKAKMCADLINEKRRQKLAAGLAAG